MIKMRVPAWRKNTSILYRKKLEQDRGGLHVMSTFEIIQLIILQTNMVTIRADVSILCLEKKDLQVIKFVTIFISF